MAVIVVLITESEVTPANDSCWPECPAEQPESFQPRPSLRFATLRESDRPAEIAMLSFRHFADGSAPATVQVKPIQSLTDGAPDAVLLPEEERIRQKWLSGNRYYGSRYWQGHRHYSAKPDRVPVTLSLLRNRLIRLRGQRIQARRPHNDKIRTSAAYPPNRRAPRSGSRFRMPSGADCATTWAWWNRNMPARDVHADRLRALSALLPQISATARQGFENISYREIGLKLPPIPGLPALPATSGGFGYQDVRVGVSQPLFDHQLHERYQARKQDEQASVLSMKDARDVVVLAVGTGYFQVVASAARVETAKAQVAAAREFDELTANRVKSEVSPEIESLRAQVERQSAEQRLTNFTNQLEKDKLTFARITGLAIDQDFELTDKPSPVSLAEMTLQGTTREALRGRADLASAEAAVHAAESTLKAEKAQRLPVLSFTANYGGGGRNVGSLDQVYQVAGAIAVPLYTGGRIRADIGQAQSISRTPSRGICGLARTNRLRRARGMAGRQRFRFQRQGGAEKSCTGRTCARAIAGPLYQRRNELSRSGAGAGSSRRRQRELHRKPVFIQHGDHFPGARHGRRRGQATSITRRQII